MGKGALENEGAEFSFEWSTPPFSMRANFLGEPGIRSTQEQTQFEMKARERRRFKTLKEYAQATGQDAHSILVDYDAFVHVTPPGPDPRTLYKPADFDKLVISGESGGTEEIEDENMLLEAMPDFTPFLPRE